MALSKKCSKCDEINSVEAFYLVKGKPVQPCKDCRRTYAKAWRKDNPEYYNNWASENKDKVKEKNQNYQSKRRLAKPVVAMLLALSFVTPAFALSVPPSPTIADVACRKNPVGIFPVERVVRIVDGDTQDLLINLGLDTYTLIRTRLIGVDTPETRGAEKPEGEVAKAYTIKWFDEHKDLKLIYFGRGKFGRALSVVRGGDDFLNVDIITSGNHAAKHLGVAYCGGSRKAKPKVTPSAE
jgi:micrococcal nuclease